MEFIKRPLIVAGCVALMGSFVFFIVTSYQPPPSQTQIDGLRVLYLPVNTLDDIKPPNGVKVFPIAYTSVIPFTDLTIQEKKEKFFQLMLPAVLISKYKLARQREEVHACMQKGKLSGEEQQWVYGLFKKYRVSTYQDLLGSMQDHPTSIVMAQAAIETGWGKSRFFMEANNVFGVWSFNPDEPRIKADATRNGKVIYVKKYSSLIESVDDYFMTIARGPYKKFRQARLAEDNPNELVEYLLNYSELRLEYVSRLQKIISFNELEKFDSFHIDPDFIIKSREA